MKVGKWMGSCGLGMALLLTACNNQAAPQQPQPTRTQSINNQTVPGPETVIPSVDRDKKFTTNAQGSTYSGMGTNVYSSIGSSHLHSGGPSTKLEAQLNAAGVHGVQALVLKDAIVICPATAGSHSINQMDPMQSHLLSNFTGSSARGNEHTTPGSAGTLGTSDLNATLKNARTHIHRLYGKEKRVLTVTSKAGIAAFDQAKKQLHETGQDPHASTISKLMREAKQ
ncbi:hypothetical protein [Brevibacillus choshinensis]|uniref:Sporulation protein n=1 Tax=Brevibacillus choshinensis TaxID=54911 RepID=A0ABX7FP75_BRECH|nr:hypothetical protein [Brevibacillus choshinensis]QRG67467.1 hypothetical protein JNE38_29235 [Brevibacillus choshinensis]